MKHTKEEPEKTYGGDAKIKIGQIIHEVNDILLRDLAGEGLVVRVYLSEKSAPPFHGAVIGRLYFNLLDDIVISVETKNPLGVGEITTTSCVIRLHGNSTLECQNFEWMEILGEAGHPHQDSPKLKRRVLDMYHQPNDPSPDITNWTVRDKEAEEVMVAGSNIHHQTMNQASFVPAETDFTRHNGGIDPKYLTSPQIIGLVHENLKMIADQGERDVYTEGGRRDTVEDYLIDIFFETRDFLDELESD